MVGQEMTAVKEHHVSVIAKRAQERDKNIYSLAVARKRINQIADDNGIIYKEVILLAGEYLAAAEQGEERQEAEEHPHYYVDFVVSEVEARDIFIDHKHQEEIFKGMEDAYGRSVLGVEIELGFGGHGSVCGIILKEAAYRAENIDAGHTDEYGRDEDDIEPTQPGLVKGNIDQRIDEEKEIGAVVDGGNEQGGYVISDILLVLNQRHHEEEACHGDALTHGDHGVVEKELVEKHQDDYSEMGRVTFQALPQAEIEECGVDEAETVERYSYGLEKRRDVSITYLIICIPQCRIEDVGEGGQIAVMALVGGEVEAADESCAAHKGEEHEADDYELIALPVIRGCLNSVGE